MAGGQKMAVIVFFLLNIIVLIHAHEELNNNNLAQLSSSEIVEARRIPKGQNQEWQYEGIPIALSKRLKAPDVPAEAVTPETTLKPWRKHIPPLSNRYRRIYDPDETATIEDYPFMAAVLVNKELWCGAAVIDKETVLTAAHCLQLQYNNRFFREYVKMLTVRVGSSNATSGGEVYRVVEIEFHPNYKPATLEFNAAVLRLHKNMTFGVEPDVRDIAYSRAINVPADNNLKFLGWGSVLGGGGVGGTVLLQQVELPVYDFADCQAIYGKELVTTSNFCAGYITKKKNVCNHDAGGPAVMGDKLIGILSFSAKRCDNLDHPAVFTSVGTIAPWLDDLSEKPGARSLKMV